MDAAARLHAAGRSRRPIRRTRTRTIRPRRAGKEALLRDAVRGRAARAVQRRRGDRQRRAWARPGESGQGGRARPATIPPPAARDRRSQTERDQPRRQLHAPQRADGDQRRLLAAVAVLGRARRFALEPGAEPPEGTAECAGSRLKVVHVLYDNYHDGIHGAVRRRNRSPTASASTAGRRDAGRRTGCARPDDRPSRSTTTTMLRPTTTGGREPRLRELRQGDRRLRAPAGQQRLRAVAVR